MMRIVNSISRLFRIRAKISELHDREFTTATSTTSLECVVSGEELSHVSEFFSLHRSVWIEQEWSEAHDRGEEEDGLGVYFSLLLESVKIVLLQIPVCSAHGYQVVKSVLKLSASRRLKRGL
jgi:hypothetical protein